MRKEKKSGKVTVNCLQCDIEFETYRCWVKRGHGKFCSKKCEGRWRSEHIRGKDHPLWSRVTCNCEQCGKEIEVSLYKTKDGRKLFCSRVCLNQWRSENLIGEKGANWKGGDVKATCSQCNVEFDMPRRRVRTDRGNFCSRDCYIQWQSENVPSGEESPYWDRVNCSCEQCGKEFAVKVSVKANRKGRFCSLDCKAQWQSENNIGEKAPGWQGGLSFEPYTPEFNKILKSYIRKRDNHTCALCGKRAKSVHHIDYNKQESSPENLITLCRKCHTRTNHNRRFWRTILAPVARRREGLEQ